MRDLKNARTRLLLPSITTLCFFAVTLLSAPVAWAQDDEQKGIDQGNYNIKQSIEFGGRLTSIGGDVPTYDTFVNLQEGARLLGFTTEMNSLNHHGAPFDRLYFDNFGYGGDPNNVSRLRISKNQWYDFDFLFRRDVNYSNYSLLANPLNPTAPFANGPPGSARPCAPVVCLAIRRTSSIPAAE